MFVTPKPMIKIETNINHPETKSSKTNFRKVKQPINIIPKANNMKPINVTNLIGA